MNACIVCHINATVGFSLSIESGGEKLIGIKINIPVCNMVSDDVYVYVYIVSF